MKMTVLHMRARTTYPKAFDPGKAGKWKVDGDGHIVLQDGNPVFIDANGGEITLGTDTVSRLNGEAKALRIRAEEAENKLKPFEGIDAAKAKEALQTVQDISSGDLIKKGEAERVRNEIKATFESQIADKDKTIAEKDSRLTNLVRSTAFSTSQFVKDNIAVPVDMVEALFGNRFKEVDGKLIAFDAQGNKMVSKKKAGEYADFDEGLSLIIEGYASKDAILKGSNNRGSGNNGGGTGTGNRRTYRRGEFDKLAPAEQHSIITQVNKGEAQLID